MLGYLGVHSIQMFVCVELACISVSVWIYNRFCILHIVDTSSCAPGNIIEKISRSKSEQKETDLVIPWVQIKEVNPTVEETPQQGSTFSFQLSTSTYDKS